MKKDGNTFFDPVARVLFTSFRSLFRKETVLQFLIVLLSMSLVWKSVIKSYFGKMLSSWLIKIIWKDAQTAVLI